MGRLWQEVQRVDSSIMGVQIRTPPRPLPGLDVRVCDSRASSFREGIQVTALRHEERLCVAWGPFPAGSWLVPTSRGLRELVLRLYSSWRMI